MTRTKAVIKEALAAGFSSAVPLNPKKLNFMEEVRAMCTSNKCRNYDNSWSCPPACGTLDEMAERAGNFDSGALLQTTASLADSFDYEGMMAAEERHLNSLNTLAEKLRTVLPDMLVLGTGGCRICKNCTYPSAPCRFPDRMTISMEACGLLVSRVCVDCGIPYYYGPGTLTYVACVLFREESFKSKQNHVVPFPYGELQAVRKTFSSEHRLEQEMRIMDILSTAGLSVPKLYVRDGSSLIYEMLAGETLLHLLESGSLSDRAVASFADWLVKCWEVLKNNYGDPFVLGDIHLANFKWDGMRVTGFDFEECCVGHPEADLGLLLAFIVMYEPSFTEYEFIRAKTLLREIRARTALSEARLKKSLTDAFHLLCKRRKLSLNPDTIIKAIDRLLTV